MHAIWAILTLKKKGYSRHPETLRWKGKLKALSIRHDLLVKEFNRRGYNHNTPLDKSLARGSPKQDVLVDPIGIQKSKLGRKKCGCRV